MARWFRLSMVLLIALPILASMPVKAQNSNLTIIASTSILADVASQVAGDAARVNSLFPRGTNAHSAEPSAQDIARLSDADLVLVVGARYEEGLNAVLNEAAGDRVVVVSSCVPFRPVTIDVENSQDAGTVSPTSDSSDLQARCGSDTEAVQAAFGLDDLATADSLGPLYSLDCGNEGIGGCDPHVWTDPVNVALWTLFIRDTLIEHDPANADVYTANAEAYLAQLVDLDQQIRTTIETIPEGNRILLTNHLTFGYFAARYGLDLVGVIIPGGSTSAEPSVQDVLDLIQLVQDTGVPAIFTENVVSDSLAKQIADETGVKMVRLYTELLGEPGKDADTYLSYMLYNASSIAGALK